MHKIDDDGKENSFRRIGILLGVVAVLGLAGVILGPRLFSSKEKPEKRETMMMVALRPLPTPPPVSTPPPTPPPQEQVKEEKMIAQEPVDPNEEKPEPPKSTEPIGTNVQGNGSDAFGLSGNGGGMKLGGPGSGRKNRRWGWYAGQVQNQIGEALRKNRKTRNGAFRSEVRVWPDATGRVTKASLGTSTGDAELDEAIKNEVLSGLQLQEPPPPGMPLPIVMRITARRPN